MAAVPPLSRSGGAPEAAPGSGKRVLYITLDGLSDPLGRSQVLPYLTGLSRRGHRITILSCEKPEQFERDGAAVRALCDEAGLAWQPIPYRRWPPVAAGAWNSMMLERRAHRLHRRFCFDLVHCRSYIAAAAGLSLKRRHALPLLFDMRGFWPDERLESGRWPQANPLFRLVYRHFKKLEAALLHESSHVVSLTECGKKELLRRPGAALDERNVSIIPCCVDFDRFGLPSEKQRLSARQELGIAPEAAVLAYIGSLGGNYMLDEMLRFFLAFREKYEGARFLFITQTHPSEIERSAKAMGIASDELAIRSASHPDVPRLAAAADAGIAFKQAGYSAKACSPTKLGEMLALGIPVVVNSGVGDVEQVMEQTGAGVVVDGFDRHSLEAAVAGLAAVENKGLPIRLATERIFALGKGIDRYDGIYRQLGEQRQGVSQTVLVLGSYAPSLLQFRGSFIAAMVERGHRVVAAAPDIPSQVAARLQELGAEPRELPLARTSLDPLGMLGSLRRLRRLIREERPDVLVAYTIKPVILGALAGRAERVPRIVSLITGVGYAFTGGREPKRLLSRAVAAPLYKAALRRSDAIVFQNPDDEALFRRLRLVPEGRETRRVSGSGIDLKHFAPVPLPETPSFLMIARLLRDKGIREFAEASKRLKAEHPEARIALVGFLDSSPDSLSRSELDALVACGIDYRGQLDDVRPAIADCSVYVLPSYREGTPRSVLEAMAMGRAIVTSDAPGCRETVRDGENGLLVAPRDSAALYQAMLRFVREPGLAAPMGKASRRLAEEKFDVRAVNDALLEIARL